MADILPVRLRRAQMNRPGGLDITVKSGQDWARAFAPTWEMVCGHKNHKAELAGKSHPYPQHPSVTDEEYTQRYYRILQVAPPAAWRALYDLGVRQGYDLTVKCYCRDDQFCHTHLFITYVTHFWPERFVRAEETPEPILEGMKRCSC